MEEKKERMRRKEGWEDREKIIKNFAPACLLQTNNYDASLSPFQMLSNCQ
jgi:hypothetical protein